MSPNDKGRPAERTAFAGENNTASLGDNPGLDRAIENADSWWWQGAWKVLLELVAAGGPFTIDNVPDRVGEPADPHHPGALMAAAYRPETYPACRCSGGC